MWTMFVRISHAAMVSGIVGGVWLLGAAQQSDLRVKKSGLPALMHPVHGEHRLELSSISEAD